MSAPSPSLTGVAYLARRSKVPKEASDLARPRVIGQCRPGTGLQILGDARGGQCLPLRGSDFGTEQPGGWVGRPPGRHDLTDWAIAWRQLATQSTPESPPPMQSLLGEPVPYGRASTGKQLATWNLLEEQTVAKLQPSYVDSCH